MNAAMLRQWASANALPHLLELRRDLQGLRGAVLASDDGFALAEVLDGQMDGNKLAAMASSLYGLSEATTREAGLPGCRDVIVDGLGGKLVLMSVPDVSRLRLVLLAAVDEQSAFGQVLLQCRKCCSGIGDVLRDAAF